MARVYNPRACKKLNYTNPKHQERFNILKSQDPENEHFDVTFEIGGKTILANKLLLTSASEYMNALLSERWTKKDEPVKIEDYSYDNFYEFLRFLYLGSCNLTNENVFQLTDMAECYDVTLFKKYCENFLSKMKYDVEKIEEMFDFSQQYSLSKMEASLKIFVANNLDTIMKTNRYLSSKKAFVDFVSLLKTEFGSEKAFEAVYKWTEHQVIEQKDAGNGNFNLLEAVKTELRETFPQIYSMDKTEMSYEFLLIFMVEKGFFLSSNEIKTIFEKYHRVNEEVKFKWVYDLAEKQALQKQKMSSDGENFNLVDSFIYDMIKVVSLVKFGEMHRSFLMKYAVPKGFLTKKQADRFCYTYFSVKNGSKIITGDFKDDIGIGRTIELKSPYKIKRSSDKIIRFLDLKFRMPKTPSIVKKTDGIEWYLSLDKDRVLSFKHHTMVNSSDYLLAEMKSETEFSLTPNETTTIQASFNVLNDILQ